jgi:hypothetical protein
LVGALAAEGRIMTAQLFGALFTAGAFVFALSVYLIFMQWRRLKYMQMADALGAQYQSQGFASTGEIIGSNHGRKYKIETKASGRSGMWTVASLESVNRGIGLSIHGGFFKTFPNWRFVYMRGDGSERLSGVNVTLLNAGLPLEEKYKLPVQRLFQQIALPGADALKKGNLKIEQDAISFTRRGVLTKVEVIRQIISQLTEVARRIESEPVL